MFREIEKTHLYFLRHCKTTFNIEGKISGGEDIPICESEIVLLPKNQHLDNYIIVTSPLERCLQTINLFQSKNQIRAKKIIIDEKLIERNMGDMTGKFREEMIQKYPTFFKSNKRFNPASTPPNGESLADFSIRISRFICDLEKIQKKYNQNILICSHNQTLKMIYTLIYEKNIEDVWEKINFENGKAIPVDEI